MTPELEQQLRGIITEVTGDEDTSEWEIIGACGLPKPTLTPEQQQLAQDGLAAMQAHAQRERERQEHWQKEDAARQAERDTVEKNGQVE